MSRASQIRETSDATLYLKARERGDVELLRGCLFRLREQFQVDDRVLVRALNSGQKQGARRGRPRKPPPGETELRCPHCNQVLVVVT